MWLVPSRSRPHRLARLIQIGVSQSVIVGLDEDDPMLGGYLTLAAPDNWLFEVSPRRPLSGIYNDWFRAMPDLGWYGFLADDVEPETESWEQALIETAGRDGLAFGDDGINGANHAAHFVLGGDLAREVGFLCLPGLHRLYIDTAWCDIARERGVFRYRPDVKLTHAHFSNHRAFLDATYQKPMRDADRIVYKTWRGLDDHASRKHKEQP